jgi:transposase-like protein
MAFAYSTQTRETAVKKALTGSDSVRDIAGQMGVGLSTLQRWLREARKSGEPVMAKQEKRPQDWTREERLNALLEAAKLSEEELGAWCRQKGIHTHHLEKWRKGKPSRGGFYLFFCSDL